LTETQTSWPQSPQLKYLLTNFAGLAPDYRLGKLKENQPIFQVNDEFLVYDRLLLLFLFLEGSKD
jgi:hypothetical protein